MTDRELLEKAAKAAGYQVNLLADNPDHWYRWDTPDKMIWNPLTYDGDALRLAVKLNIIIEPGPEYTYAMAPPRHDFCIEEGRHSAEQAGDATRRAIVRAAAAMAERTA